MLPTPHNHLLLLAVDANSTQEEALAAVCSGQGLRFYAPELNLEPLCAFARRGWRQAFAFLLERSHFEPHEATLNQALRLAAQNGFSSLAIDAWRFGASLDFDSIFLAVEHGSAACIFELIDAGAATVPVASPSLGGRMSDLDFLFECCASKALDEECVRCISRGADLRGQRAEKLANLVFRHGMARSAAAWLSSGASISPCSRLLWMRAFPALMLAQTEKTALSGAFPLASKAGATRL